MTGHFRCAEADFSATPREQFKMIFFARFLACLRSRNISAKGKGQARRRAALGCAAVAMGLLFTAAPAYADFGIVPGSVTVTALNRDGTVDSQAGSHPYTYTVSFAFNKEAAGHTEGGEVRDILADLPTGFSGYPLVGPRCTRQEFDEGLVPGCSPASQVGILRADLPGLGLVSGPIYNLAPPPGVVAQLGFSVNSLGALQDASVHTEEGYGLGIDANSIPTELTSVEETIWGVPGDPGHDPERGVNALEEHGPPLAYVGPKLPFLTLPASCSAPGVITIKADSKLAPGLFVEESGLTRDAGGNLAALTGCDAVPFSPKIAAQPTSKLAENPTGLDFELTLPNQGLLSPGGVTETEPRKTVVTLPEGLTVNPSFAEGVAVCSLGAYGAEQIDSMPGEGCPEASKVGSVIAQSPLLEEPIEGSVYLAAPFENPFGTLVSIYFVARAPERGVLIKQAGSVELDPASGRLTTTFDGLPPLPYSSFKLHFREGARAPLATPQACGEYKTVARLTPFSALSDAEAVEQTGSMQIERGAEGGACPGGGTPSFHPGLQAGMLNNAAGRYSPFYLRLTRTDAEQEITHFSIKLPPGVTGKLAGIPFCSDASIAAAKARTGPHGGQEELEHPSCPPTSEVGHLLAGVGVGGALAYAPGKIYLAGPYHGSALSIAAITAAKVGPFDLGTVVVREALKVNPETAEVFIDATGSDPFPHIIQGVPVRLRDIRVYVDRPEFTLNPTSCDRTSTASTVLGSGTNFTSESDDQPVTITSPFQAADCAGLGFAPKLSLSLKGGTRRSANPAFKAVVTYPKGSYANIKSARVTLPHSEFLEQGHIKTVCTRVQFAAGGGNGEQCPEASIYGRATAITPLLSEPLSGPVYLRSSSHTLPDLVAALHSGEINIDLDGRIDSAKGGRIRNTFEAVPDAPVTKFTLEMFGGKKSLLANSTNVCKGKHLGIAEFKGHNGKKSNSEPPLQAQCGKKTKGKSKAKKGGKGSKASVRMIKFGW